MKFEPWNDRNRARARAKRKTEKNMEKLIFCNPFGNPNKKIRVAEAAAAHGLVFFLLLSFNQSLSPYFNEKLRSLPTKSNVFSLFLPHSVIM
jgi:hypothetical protein